MWRADIFAIGRDKVMLINQCPDCRVSVKIADFLLDRAGSETGEPPDA